MAQHAKGISSHAQRRQLLSAAGAGLATMVAPTVWAQSTRAPATVAAPAPLSIGGSTAGQALLRAWVARFSAGSTYEGIGSGAAIERAGSGGLDIGVSDVPLTATALAQQGLVQIPLFADGIAVVLNAPGAAQLKLPDDALIEIFRGSQTNMEANGMGRLNPGTSLSTIKPVPFGRIDASGSTATFTNYLARRSRTWAKEFSSGLQVRWPGSVRMVRGSGEMRYWLCVLGRPARPAARITAVGQRFRRLYRTKL
jgi:phosphate transport system substrate-binding protein